MKRADSHDEDIRPVLACLGVASRFRLVRALAEADRCVGELARAVGLSQSCTTRHLQTLERVGLVKGRREGRRVRFTLRAQTPGLGELLGWALSGAGLEGLLAGADLHLDRGMADPVRGIARRPSPGAQRRARRPGSTRGGVEGERPRAGEPGLSGGLGQSADEPAGHEEGGGSGPAQRPGELEDYLL